MIFHNIDNNLLTLVCVLKNIRTYRSFEINISRHCRCESRCQYNKYIAPVCHVNEPVSEFNVQCQGQSNERG